MHVMRLQLMIAGGPLAQLDPHLEAAHTCHRPWCVNPDHGVWATHEENMEMGYERK